MLRYFSLRKTIEGLRGDGITESMKMRYYLATSLIASCSLQLEAWSGVRGVNNGAQFAGWFLSLLVTIVGTVFIFDMNKAHGRFLDKMICLSVPILMYLIAIYYAGNLMVGLVAGILGKTDSMNAMYQSELFRPASEFVLAACYTLCLGLSVHNVNRNFDRQPR
jgi:hypothetical protein